MSDVNGSEKDLPSETISLDRIVVLNKMSEVGSEIQAELFEISRKVSLLEVSRQIMSSLNLEEVLIQITNYARLLLEVDFSTVALLESQLKAWQQGSGLEFEFNSFAPIFLEGKGLGGRAYRSAQTAKTSDYWMDPTIEHSPLIDEQVKQRNLSAAMIVPVLLENKVVALLGVYKRTPYEWNSREQLKAEQLASLVGLALHNAEQHRQLENLNQQLRVRNQQLEELQEFSQLLQSSLNLKTMAEQALTLALEVVHGTAGTLHLVERHDPEELSLYYQTGLTKTGRHSAIPDWLTHIKFNGGLIGKAAATNQTIVIEDDNIEELITQNPTITFDHTFKWRSAIVTPLITNNKTVGVICLSASAAFHFSTEQVQFVEMVTRQMAISVQQMNQIEEYKERDQLEAVLTLARTIGHDLSQPLAVLQLALDLISEPINQSDDNLIDMMQQSITLMAKRVRDYQKIKYYKTIQSQSGLPIIDYVKTEV